MDFQKIMNLLPSHLYLLIVMLLFISSLMEQMAYGYSNPRYMPLRSSNALVSTSQPPTSIYYRGDASWYYNNFEDNEDIDQRIQEYNPVSRRLPRHPAPLQTPRPWKFNNHISFNNNHVNWQSSDNEKDEDYQSEQAQPGELTAHKINALSTHESVMESRRNHDKYNKELRKMAMDHQNKILKNGICSVPMPKIHYVAFETNAQYIPRATILHRCDESTGCCDAEFACVAKTEETVELAFIVVVNYRREEPRLIKMVNHTECECRRQSERSKRSTSCLCPLHFTDFSGPEPETQKGKGISTKLATEHRCRCDCHLSDDICKRLKNGEEGFSLEERLRIKHGESSPPFCNYGPYDMDNGRCPRPKNHQSHQIQFQSKRQHGRS